VSEATRARAPLALRDDGVFAQPAGMAFDVHEALDKDLEGLVYPLLHREQMSEGDRVIIVPRKFSKISSQSCFQDQIFSTSKVVYQVCAMPLMAITKLLVMVVIASDRLDGNLNAHEEGGRVSLVVVWDDLRHLEILRPAECL
jgi:hypothetical protein